MILIVIERNSGYFMLVFFLRRQLQEQGYDHC